ncbi:MAG: SsrA-binding protein SmpB [Tenericutes bacterium]|nr:SsrA-binding protein SmpB [Mycoplasmatota bacterium]
MEIYNRKAKYDYFIIDEYECGIELLGTEIKSIRKGAVNFNDCYGRVKNQEVFLINMYIAKYEEGNIFNHDERRERKLLLNKKEIIKIEAAVFQKRYTLVPLKLYFVRNKAKILLGVCEGKKLYDKRESIKEKDLKRKELVEYN